MNAVSVVICTYNRAASLQQTFETCCDLVIPKGVSWELLLVDNNSEDHTKQVCDNFTGKLPLRYIFEPRQGKSYALNTAARVAFADLLLFTDDDVDVDPHWLAELFAAATRHPEASFFGGRIIPIWDIPPPRWFAQHATSLLSRPLVSFCLSETEEPANTAIGANMALHKSIFTHGFTYPTHVGPRGNEAVRGEETHLICQLRSSGHTGWFVPTAIVLHRTEPHRLTETYVRQWYIGDGMSEVRLGQIPQVGLWFGVPRFYWKRLILSSIKYGSTRLLPFSKLWLTAAIDMAHAWGVIRESRKKIRQRQNNSS